MSITSSNLMKMKATNPEFSPAIDAMLVSGLSEQQRRVYGWTSAEWPMSSKQIAARCEMSELSASQLLLDIHRKGLLTRSILTNKDGRRFVYRRAGK